MSGKRKRDEDEFEFTPPSAKLSKAQKDEGIHKMKLLEALEY
jgi:hypothetical protein